MVLIVEADSREEALDKAKDNISKGDHGVVKGLIPVDRSRVLYVYHKHTANFLKRQKIKRLWRKLGITRIERRSLKYGHTQQPLTKWQN